MAILTHILAAAAGGCLGILLICVCIAGRENQD